MAFDAFLKLEGIDGGSTAKGYEGWIEVISFSWGASNPQSIGSATSGAGAGKVQFQEFHVTKHLDGTSPKLFLACATGGHIKTAQIDLVRASQKATEVFFTYKLSDVVVSSVANNGTSRGQDVPLEEVSLNFGRVEELVPAIKPATGGVTPPTDVTWDLTANAAQ